MKIKNILLKVVIIISLLSMCANNISAQIFFSEYIEGSWHNKALEIYNAGSYAVDLSDITIEKDLDGNNIFNEVFSLKGFLQPKKTYVIVHSKANDILKRRADIICYNQVLNFNGNDQIRLMNRGLEIDRIGIKGNVFFAEKVTLIRNRGINDHVTNEKWLRLPCDYIENMGNHNTEITKGVFISEYQEGKGYDKSIEIYNGGVEDCYLSDFVIQRDNNGDNRFEYSYALPINKELKKGETFVIRNIKASGTDNFFRARTDVLNFNGNDQVRLLYKCREVDRIGCKYNSGYFAKDKVLRRKSNIWNGRTGYRNINLDDWIICNKSDISNLGSHNVSRKYYNFSDGKNYTVTLKPSVALKKINADNLYDNNVSASVEYYDGFGHRSQVTSIMASPDFSDINIPVKIDAYGRETIKYLPYKSDKNIGEFDNYRFSNQLKYYRDQDKVQEVTDFPYAVEVLDNSPLNRVLKRGNVGEEWQPVNNDDNDHVKKYYYGGNEKYEVLEFYIDHEVLVCQGYYKESKLELVAVVDENNNNTIIEYKNFKGETILKRVYLSDSEIVDTYYVYNDLGQLCYVLSPKAIKLLKETFIDNTPDIELTNTDSIIIDLCYYYIYDKLNRNIIKGMPGSKPIYMVYDKYDRLVMTQNGEHRKTNQWLYMKYDRFNRVIQTGIYTSSTNLTQKEMSSRVESNSNMFEICVDGVYSNECFPQINTILYTENIYDRYYSLKYPTLQFIPEYNIDNYNGDFNDKVKGLVTYVKTRVLEASDDRSSDTWAMSANYYDDMYNKIQTVSRDTLPDGKTLLDISGTSYSFTGRVDSTIYVHKLSDKDPIIVMQFNEFDHSDRLLRTYQRIDGAIQKDKFLYSSFVYDNLGKAVKKYLNNNTINVDYNYNVRGWLKDLSYKKTDGDNLFSMSLYYNDISNELNTVKQFNGNISAIQWRNGDDGILQSYGYRYDSINRIKSANYVGTKQGGYNTSYSYDINGNILTLNRSMVNVSTGIVESIDKLKYKYGGGNQLNSVTDTGTEDGFKQGSGNYIYNDNGNMVIDPNKGLSNIKYNHINIPYSIIKEGKSIDYIYDATGRKLANKTDNKVTYYFGKFVYSNDKILYLICSDGVLNINERETNYEYHLKDHLGNTRVAVNETNDITQTNNYYPFGLTFATSGSSTNKYLYNGKEEQEETEWLDYGARFYSPDLGRWFIKDPKTEKYYSCTPYNFCLNNPLLYTDPDGEDPITAIVDAITAFVVEAGMSYVENIVLHDMDLTKAFENIRWGDASVEALKSYAISVFISGTGSIKALSRAANSKLGKIVIDFVGNVTSDLVKKYNAGEFNDTDGDFSFDKFGEADFSRIMINGAIEALVAHGFSGKANKIEEKYSSAQENLRKQADKQAETQRKIADAHRKNLKETKHLEEVRKRRAKKVDKAQKDIMKQVVKSTTFNAVSGTAGKVSTKMAEEVENMIHNY
jgi:RHS repeat-associated protein